MLKMERDYEEKYGDIPAGMLDRLDYLLHSFKSNKCLKGQLINRLESCFHRKWKEIRYTIYLLPKATPRPRSTNYGFFYVKGAGDNKKLFLREINNLGWDMIKTPVRFHCTSYLPIPNSMNNLEKVLAELGFIYPLRPDFDNLIKTYTDMLKGTLLWDDSIIFEGISKKYYSVKPRIEIRIEYMEDFDSDFNKKKILK